MIFSNIVLVTLKYNLNLISFSQLRKIRILYYNYLKNIILKKAGNIIGFVQKKKNFFVLDLENNANKIMIAQLRG